MIRASSNRVIPRASAFEASGAQDLRVRAHEFAGALEGLRDAGPGSLVAGSAGRPRASTRGPILAQTTRNADWTYYRPMSNLLAKIRQWFGFDKKPDEPNH